MRVEKFDTISEVPDEWDTLIGDNLYLSKDFLTFIETNDKCNQQYYAIYDDDDKLDTIFMTHVRDRFNLATFAKFDMYTKTTLVYVPLSVTRPGLIGNKCIYYAFEVIKKIKGPKIVLNMGDYNPKGFAKGLNWAKCIFTNKFKSFDEYMNALRSNYRRRYKKAFEKSKDLTIELLKDNNDFNEEMYDCYLQIVKNSSMVIEVLPIEFFRGKYFKIFVLRNDEKVVGFYQLIENGPELIFEFVGVDYTYNDKYDTYHRILLEIMKYGIDNGFKTIDYGQTADEAKLKLGSKYELLYAYLHHSNFFINCAYRLLAPLIEFKPVLANKFNVFKEEDL